MTKNDLDVNEFDPYYWRYIDKLSGQVKLRDSFILGKGRVLEFFAAIPAEKHDYAYAAGKWSCKEVLQHLIDTERIFQYRCFRISRNDKTALAGFDQNIYREPSGAESKTMKALLGEFSAVRDSSIALVNSLGDEALKNRGSADGGTMSARAAAFTITGHDLWHMEIISERYL